MLRINLELLGPLVQQMGMNPQIAGYLRRRRSALTNKPHRLKLELPSVPSSHHVDIFPFHHDT